MQLAVITRERFSNKAWWPHTTYAFAARSNAIPVVVSELPKLIPTMPLGFVRTEETFQLVAITSLQPNTNLFVDLDGNWIGDYIPAAVRAYPFHLVKSLDSGDSVLCFDESSDLLVDAGQGEPFFDEDGPSPSVTAILSFLSDTETSRVLTQRLVDTLQAANVIRPWALNLLLGEQTVPVESLYRIDEATLNALPDKAFNALRKAGSLTLAYAQMFSMNQLAMLSRAAEIQASLREKTGGSDLRQTQAVANMGFGLVAGETLRFL